MLKPRKGLRVFRRYHPLRSYKLARLRERYETALAQWKVLATESRPIIHARNLWADAWMKAMEE
jgi:hypothetical protein